MVSDCFHVQDYVENSVQGAAIYFKKHQVADHYLLLMHNHAKTNNASSQPSPAEGTASMTQHR
jgi:hypothetical protein